MTDLGALRRLEAAIGAVALTVALGVLAVGIDAARFHLPDVLREGPFASPGHALACAIACAELAVVGLGAASLARQLLTTRRVMRRLAPARRHVSRGVPVMVVQDARPCAFCAGLLRPRVYMSEGALALLSPEELAAVIAHEAHHAARRDPLRRLLMQSLADALRLVPGLRTLGQRQAALAELTADAVAVRRVGAARGLASALLTLSGQPGGGIAPERVDHLLGRLPRGGASRCALVLLAAALALVGTAVLTLLAPGHHDLCALVLGGSAPVVAAAGLAALVAWTGRRAVEALRPLD